MNCRHCKEDLSNVFIDLGHAPPSNNYLDAYELSEIEISYPLKLYVCSNCWLVQTVDYSNADELFKSDYAYLSSTSTTWLEHASLFVDKITSLLNLDEDSFVIEIASNDGYLLKNFVRKQIPCLGIEPTEGTAQAAEKLGVEVLKEFFGSVLAEKLSNEGNKADLLIGNNVYPHIPDINDFSLGMKKILNKKGTITLEFQHLLELIKHKQFDTIYHEHFSYLSLYTVLKIFNSVDLKVYDVKKLSTHGGSLRVYGCHENDQRDISESVSNILNEEKDSGMQSINFYKDFQFHAEKIKEDFYTFLLNAKNDNKRVGAYGAAAKGNTLLNFAGVKSDLIEFVCDAALSKQKKYLPGSHIPIVSPMFLEKLDTLDYLVIFPWNIASEIIRQVNHIRRLNTKFVVAIPELKIF